MPLVICKTWHPWCKICVVTRCFANEIVIVWFAKMPPRGAVLVFYRWLLVANTRGKRFGSRWWGVVCAHGRLFCAGCGKVVPRGAVFCALVGKWSKLQSVCKQVAHGWGALANCNQKATPWWQKCTFWLAVVWQSGGNGAIGCHCKNTHTGWVFSPFRTWVAVCRLGAGGRFFLPPCRCCIGFVGQFARHLGQVARQCGVLAPRWACRLWKTCKFQK